MTAPTPVVDPVAQPILDTLLVAMEIEVAKVPNPPAVVCMRPGDRIDLLISQLRDECCEGLAWIRVAGIYPSTNFPTQDETFQKCQTGWGVQVELGVARCAPVGDENNLPSCDEWTAATNNVTADAAALRRTLLRWKTLEENRFRQYIPGGYLPLTTEGGCVGGAMLVTFAAPACDRLED